MKVMPTIAIAHADRVGGMDILDTWAVELEKYAKELGYNVVDISGMDLTYERITQILQATNPAILFYFGPGDKMHLYGNDMKPALTSNDCPTPSVAGTIISQEDAELLYEPLSNLHAIAETAVIAYSSLAAQQLGPEIIKAGSLCFIGFSNQLMIVSDKYGIQDIFKECLLTPAKRILEGWTVGAAVETTRSDMLNIVRQHKDHEVISVPMFSNRKGLTYFGDPNWKLRRK